VARSTLANSCNAHQLLTEMPPLFPGPRCPEPKRESLVLATGEREYQWRVSALAMNRSISRHKGLTQVLMKCSRLNEQRGKTKFHHSSSIRPFRCHKFSSRSGK